MMDLNQTKKILSDYNILPRQSLGQNFLVSHETVKEIITASEIQTKDQVIEVGPGLGALTEAMLKLGCQVYAYEIDHRLITVLEDRLHNYKNFHLQEEDILKVNLKSDFANKESLKVIANLPYYITSEIIEKMICELPDCQSMSFMVQKEAAQRITLTANDSRYGPTAILVNLYGHINKRINVGASHFYPRPKINSQVLFIKKNQNSLLHQRPKLNANLSVSDFKNFLNQSFAMRRKTLLNNLKRCFNNFLSKEEIKNILQKNKLSISARPQQITPEKFWQLYESMANYISSK